MDIFGKPKKLPDLVNKDQAFQTAKDVYDRLATQYGVAKVPLASFNGVDVPKLSSANVIPYFRTGGSITMSTLNQTYYIGLNFNPSVVWFFGEAAHSGSGSRSFTLSSGANATAGAVYTNNGNSYTVMNTIAGTQVLACTNGGATLGTTLTKSSGTGDATITFSASSTTDVRAMVIGQAFLGQSYYLQPQSGNSVITGGPLQKVVQNCTCYSVDAGGNARTIVGQTHLIDVSYPDANSIVARATVQGFGNGQMSIYTDNLASGWSIVGDFMVL